MPVFSQIKVTTDDMSNPPHTKDAIESVIDDEKQQLDKAGMVLFQKGDELKEALRQKNKLVDRLAFLRKGQAAERRMRERTSI